MPIETQSKILRAIEEKKIRPIGSEKEIPVDVRIIASCGMNLDKVMETGALRMDLYFRLSAIQIELPPLRERRKDIPALVRSFIDRFNREFGSNILGIDEETEDFFMRYRWPGNIRELRNTIEGAFFTAREDHIRFRDVSERFLPEDESEGEGSGAQSPERAAYEAFMESGTDLKVFMREYERQAVYQAVNSCGGDLRKAAKSLGISDQMLKYNMKKFGM